MNFESCYDEREIQLTCTNRFSKNLISHYVILLEKKIILTNKIKSKSFDKAFLR